MRFVSTAAPHVCGRRLIALVGALACSDGGGVALIVSRDSAGVRIVESMAPRWGDNQPWTVASTPRLDLTDRSGPAYEFYRVNSATRLRDGSIAITNSGSSEVRLFAPSGEFVASFGREGEGPAEFRRLTSVHQTHDDSLLAFDFWLRRVVVFGIRDGSSRTADMPSVGNRVRRIATLQNGGIVGLAYSYDVTIPNGLYRLPYAVFSFDRTTETLDTVAIIQGAEGYQYEHGDARPLFARDGSFAVHADRVYLGDGDSMQVQVHTLPGGLTMIMRVPGFDLRLTPGDLAAERAALMPPPPAPPFTREVVAAMPDRETRPAYGRLMVDAAGYLWAPEYHSVAEEGLPTDCHVFSPDGEWLGVVRLPERFTPFEIGLDYVLGVSRDDADVEHVRLLRLSRENGG